jgi:hypothetical protein
MSSVKQDLKKTKQTTIEEKIKCNRCGKCCHIIYSEVPLVLLPCKQLIKITENKHYCRIYPNRIGYKIGENETGKRFKCGSRWESEYDYEDCPYNTNKEVLY